VLADLAGRLVKARTPALGQPVMSRSGVAPVSRREAVLEEAVALFAERSYASVGIEDIARNLGIAGPSVYNHFPSKADILLAALHRGSIYLQVQAVEALRAAGSEEEALRGLVRCYVQFAIRHHDLVDLLVTEVRNLPPDRRGGVIQAQREFVAEWVALLARIHPLSSAEARLHVHAAIGIATDLARTPHVRNAGGAADAIAALCDAALGLRAAEALSPDDEHAGT
jgi:AcrR family transcriptional regulator